MTLTCIISKLVDVLFLQPMLVDVLLFLAVLFFIFFAESNCIRGRTVILLLDGLVDDSSELDTAFINGAAQCCDGHSVVQV